MNPTEASISQSRLRELMNYEPDTGTFTWRLTGKVSGASIGKRGYRQICVDGQRYYAHRLAWLYVYGQWPAGQVDHINRSRHDNRIANLRLATRQQNNWNASLRRDNTSGLKGTCLHRRTGLWQARIGVNGRQITLGYFRTAQAAHAAYAAKAREIFGEFAHDGSDAQWWLDMQRAQRVASQIDKLDLT